MKSEHIIILALNAHPNAFSQFKTLFEQNGDITLEKKYLTSQEIFPIKKSGPTLENEG